ncbi:6334_t:CDS:2, partial [Cetraspora pellucida]
MGLNTADEVNDYLNAFSAALKEKGVEEKEIEEQEKNDNSSDHDSQKNDNVIDDKTKNFISNLPLPSAKNFGRRGGVFGKNRTSHGSTKPKSRNEGKHSPPTKFGHCPPSNNWLYSVVRFNNNDYKNA